MLCCSRIHSSLTGRAPGFNCGSKHYNITWILNFETVMIASSPVRVHDIQPLVNCTEKKQAKKKIMNMQPEPLRDRGKRHGKRVMSDYCVCGPVVVVAEDVGVASGTHFHFRATPQQSSGFNFWLDWWSVEWRSLPWNAGHLRDSTFQSSRLSQLFCINRCQEGS